MTKIIAELDEWLDSMESAQTLTEDIIRTAQGRGAKIKTGSHTELVLREWIKEGIERAIALERRNARRKRVKARDRLKRRKPG